MNPTDIETLAITEIITAYFRATYNGDTNQLLSIFHPDAHITGILNGEICDLNLNEFINRVTTSPTAAQRNEKFDKKIIFIDHTSNAAMVKAQVLIGTNIFIDYITLLKINNSWLIRNKSFTT